MKRHITITISDINYLEAERRGIIQKRLLSSMLDDFLTRYFKNEIDTKNSYDLLMEKKDLEEELEKNNNARLEVSGRLGIIKAKLEELEEEKKEHQQKLSEKINKKAQVIKDSNILDEVLFND